MTRKYAVLGKPISHSKSPEIHQAALKFLNVDASYEAIELGEGLAMFLDEHTDYAGFSVTMPLKDEAYALASDLDEIARQTKSVNTLVKTENGWQGYNTDVYGIVRSLDGLETSKSLVLGTGATARSAIFALKQLGSDVSVWGRNPAQAAKLSEQFSVKSESEISAAPGFSVVVSTLPANTLDAYIGELEEPENNLLDVVYSPWPTPAAKLWLKRGVAVSGLEMLIWQAIAQQRLFAGLPLNSRLPNEDGMVAAVRAALEVAQ